MIKTSQKEVLGDQNSFEGHKEGCMIDSIKSKAADKSRKLKEVTSPRSVAKM